MARKCAICENQMGSFVRQKYKEYPSQPAAVIRAIKSHYGMTITPAQLRNHRKMHDPIAGTMVQVKRTVDRKVEELDDMLDSGRKIVGNLEGLLVKGTELDGLNWDDFKIMPLPKQVKLQIELHKLALLVKDLELKAIRLNKLPNAALANMNRIAASTFKSKPKENAEEITD